MSRIKSVKSNKRRRRISISIDDDSTITLDNEVILKAGLRPGQEIDEKQIGKLKEADIEQRCLNAAKRFIGYRPRSESEVINRLHKQGYERSLIDNVISKLKDANLVNDLEFANFWRDNRLSVNPKSKNLLKYELRRKGVRPEIAEEAISGLDDEAAATKAAEKKVRSIKSSDYPEFHDKLTNYLKWRGFNYEIIERICENMWQKKRI